jgi:hypothetical protein
VIQSIRPSLILKNDPITFYLTPSISLKTAIRIQQIIDSDTKLSQKLIFEVPSICKKEEYQEVLEQI